MFSYLKDAAQDEGAQISTKKHYKLYIKDIR